MGNYNNYKCKICDKTVDEKKHFWTEHKISESNYFQENEPKFDLLTKEKIPFTCYESYIQKDFVKRANLKKYLESLDKEEAQKYLEDWLKRRSKQKNMIFSPSQFELKNLFFPSIVYLEKYFMPCFYRSICSRANLTNRYYYDQDIVEEEKDLELTVDTREQNLLKFKNFQIKKLNFGDYTVAGSEIFIERKSLNDFLGTMSKGYDRFNKELSRCAASDSYLIILVEEKYKNLVSYKYLPHTKRVQAEPEFIHHRVRELLHNYPLNIQFLSVDGRKEAVRVMEKIFKLKNDVRNLDLQYEYDKRKL